MKTIKKNQIYKLIALSFIFVIGSNLNNNLLDETSKLVKLTDGASMEQDKTTIKLQDIEKQKNAPKRELNHLSTYYKGTTISIEQYGNYIYAANDARGLTIFNIENEIHPTISNELDFDGRVLDVKIDYPYAYLVVDGKGLIVLDMSTDLANPQLIASESSLQRPTSIYLNDSYAYITDVNKGLCVYDISDPQYPEFLAMTSNFEFPQSITGEGSTIFAADQNLGVKIFDVSNPSSPALLATYNCYACDVIADNDIVYIADRQDHLIILDCTNPSNPVKIGEYSEPYAGMTGLYLENQILYVTCTYMDMRLFNVSVLSNPTLISSCNVKYNRINDLIVYNQQFAYIAGGGGGLITVNVTDIYNPELLDITTQWGWITDISTYKSNVVVANGEGDITFIDVINPSSPKIISQYLTNEGMYREIFALEVEDDRAYIAKSWDGIDILNITDPLSPNKIGQFVGTHKRIKDIVVENGIGFLVSDEDGKLLIVNMTEPTTPYEISSISVSSAILTDIDKYGDIVVLGSRYYDYNELVFVNVSDLYNPQVLSYFSDNENTLNFKIVGNYLYLACGSSFKVFDISNITSIMKLKEFTDYYPSNFYYKNGLLYVTSFRYGLEVFNVTVDPSNLEKIASSNSLGWEYGGYAQCDTIFVNNSMVYVGSKTFGLSIFELLPDSTPPELVEITHSPADPFEGQNVTILAYLEDASGIASVTLYYRVDGSAWNEAQMEVDSQIQNKFTKNIGSFLANEKIDYYITCADNSENSNTITYDNDGLYYSFTVLEPDTQKPTIQNVFHSPSNPTSQDYVKISAEVTDNVGIASVTLYIRINGGAWDAKSMSSSDGYLYTKTLSPLDAGDYVEYYIKAVDIAANPNEAIADNNGNYYSFEVVESQDENTTSNDNTMILSFHPLITITILSFFSLAVLKRKKN
ncbi:MAG: hypothetical protein K9W45_04650 [Candidatus Heimdallarchaeum aukensis]|uniref:LVIVD repeat protein n=1 Tax=Candidatus Heimdallarchaeum aukensis TaxID=2876573 RepID=A0A9Y1FM73_9ARCH|nr:MAG: hypothetical protein K9W45_04650 [Candidatus Heimdallarchaeum aukensis]